MLKATPLGTTEAGWAAAAKLAPRAGVRTSRDKRTGPPRPSGGRLRQLKIGVSSVPRIGKVTATRVDGPEAGRASSAPVLAQRDAAARLLAGGHEVETAPQGLPANPWVARLARPLKVPHGPCCLPSSLGGAGFERPASSAIFPPRKGFPMRVKGRSDFLAGSAFRAGRPPWRPGVHGAMACCPSSSRVRASCR